MARGQSYYHAAFVSVTVVLCVCTLSACSRPNAANLKIRNATVKVWPEASFTILEDSPNFFAPFATVSAKQQGIFTFSKNESTTAPAFSRNVALTGAAKEFTAYMRELRRVEKNEGGLQYYVKLKGGTLFVFIPWEARLDSETIEQMKTEVQSKLEQFLPLIADADIATLPV